MWKLTEKSWLFPLKITALFTGMLILNETGAFILDLLKNKISEEEIMNKVLAEYSGEKKR